MQTDESLDHLYGLEKVLPTLKLSPHMTMQTIALALGKSNYQINGLKLILSITQLLFLLSCQA